MSEISNYTKMQEDLYNKERKLGKYAPGYVEEPNAEVKESVTSEKSEKSDSDDNKVKIWPFKKKKK